MKGIRILSILALIIAVVALFFHLIESNRSDLTEEGKETGFVKIGVAIPLTGKVANWGGQVKNGLELVLTKTNQPNYERIKLIYEDEQCDPKEATGVAQRLIGVDKIKIIIGAVCSSSTLSMAPITERNKVILFTPASAAEDITYAGDYVFRNHSRSSLDMTTFAKWLSGRYKKIVMFYDESSEAFVQAEKYFRASFENNSGDLVSIPFISGGVSYKTEISKIQNWRDIDAVSIEAEERSSSIIAKELKEAGINKQMLYDKMATYPAFIDLMGDLMEGIIFVQPDYDEDTNPEFWQEYNEKYGEDPTVFSAQAYDTLMILVEIIFGKGCGENTDCIRDELYKVKDYPGVAGLTSFDENGDALKQVVIKQVVNGEFVKVE